MSRLDIIPRRLPNEKIEILGAPPSTDGGKSPLTDDVLGTTLDLQSDPPVGKPRRVPQNVLLETMKMYPTIAPRLTHLTPPLGFPTEGLHTMWLDTVSRKIESSMAFPSANLPTPLRPRPGMNLVDIRSIAPPEHALFEVRRIANRPPRPLRVKTTPFIKENGYLITCHTSEIVFECVSTTETIMRDRSLPPLIPPPPPYSIVTT